MIEEETLFILGAGASVPYGYPTGKGLRKFIYEDFPRLIKKYSFDRHNEIDSNRRLRFMGGAKTLGAIFFRSSNPSIDIFLSRNEEFSPIGKMAISCGILEAEQTYKENMRERSVDEKSDWYTVLYQKMIETLHKHEDFINFGKNKVNSIGSY